VVLLPWQPEEPSGPGPLLRLASRNLLHPQTSLCPP
jgi:hypothetical protein